MADMKYTGNLWHDLCDFLVELGRERRAYLAAAETAVSSAATEVAEAPLAERERQAAAAAVPTPDDAADRQPDAPAADPVAPVG